MGSLQYLLNTADVTAECVPANIEGWIDDVCRLIVTQYHDDMSPPEHFAHLFKRRDDGSWWSGDFVLLDEHPGYLPPTQYTKGQPVYVCDVSKGTVSNGAVQDIVIATKHDLLRDSKLDVSLPAVGKYQGQTFKAIPLTGRVRKHLADHGPSTVRDMLVAFALSPDNRRERDQVSVAVNALVRIGVVDVCGKTAGARVSGRRAHIYKIAENPKAREPRDKKAARDKVLARLSASDATAREIADVERLDPHLVRVTLSNLKNQGHAVAACARLVNGRPEIVWTLTEETRSNTGSACAPSL